MIRQMTLDVSFPTFGNNYYAQHVVFRRQAVLIEDKRFDSFLMPSAINHFSNEVVGFNDQFRFLNDILASHLIDLQAKKPAKQAPKTARRRSV